jgi:hypothetical protein
MSADPLDLEALARDVADPATAAYMKGVAAMKRPSALGRALLALPDLVAEVRTLRANPRDEYHTMDELYDYRMLYNALAFNAWAAAGTYPVVKSWRHSDGELCFGGGWFIVVAALPTRPVANHYKAEHWDLFAIPEATPPTYDGHTPAIAAERMRALLNSEARS